MNAVAKEGKDTEKSGTKINSAALETKKKLSRERNTGFYPDFFQSLQPFEDVLQEADPNGSSFAAQFISHGWRKPLALTEHCRTHALKHMCTSASGVGQHRQLHQSCSAGPSPQCTTPANCSWSRGNFGQGEGSREGGKGWGVGF